MIQKTRWRSRFLTLAIALATGLLIIITAPAATPNDGQNPSQRAGVANPEVVQSSPQTTAATVLLEADGVLEAGDQVFADNSLFDIHPFTGEAGQAITIRMASDEFDTYLMVIDAADQTLGSNDDASLSDTNSTLAIALPDTGTYRILATAFDEAQRGRYRLTVTTASATDVQQIEGDRLFGQGTQQYQAGDLPAALDAWQQALEIYQSNNLREKAAITLNNLGIAHRSLGQYQAAMDVLQQALAIVRDIGDRSGEAMALNNLGNVQNSLGNYQPAIELYEQNLTIAREIGDPRSEASALGNLGLVYDTLGQHQQALEFHQQTLEIFRAIGDRASEAQALGNAGLVHYSLGDYAQAIDLYQESLAIAIELGDRPAQASALGNLGTTHHILGDYAVAINFHQQALALDQAIGDRQGEASALSSLGFAYESLADYEQAIDLYQQSLAIRRDIGDRLGEAITTSNLGITLLSMGQLAEAERSLRQSVATYESLRTDLPDAQLISLADTQAFAYAHLERALVAQGQTAAALEITERARARAFVLQLASRLPTAQVRGVVADTVANAVTAAPSIADIQQIARDQNATLITYSVIFDQALYIWVVQPSGELAFRSVEFDDTDADGRPTNPIAMLDGPVYPGGAEPSALDTLVAESRSGIGVIASPSTQSTSPHTSSTPNDHRLTDLYQVLIAPITDLLPADPTANLIFVPQGSLFLVPFAALQDAEGAYLIEAHTILTAPSLQVLNLLTRSSGAVANSSPFLQAENALVVGNPIMPEVTMPSDSGLQNFQLAPLPGTEAEAWAISDLLGLSPLIGEQATETRIKQRLPNAPLIHLATHGLLDYGAPQSSGVLDVPGALAVAPGNGEDGLLTAAEIFEMDLQAELAVLSACDTGRGRITGDGVVGLSRALITAGVPDVMVSLWAVPDMPTAALMTEFYRQLQQGQSKAQALRQAMLITRQATPDPLNWAAFTLIGAA